MSMLTLRNEYLEAAKELHDRVVLLTAQCKVASNKEESILRRRITCLYGEIRELVSTAESIGSYCERTAVREV